MKNSTSIPKGLENYLAQYFEIKFGIKANIYLVTDKKAFNITLYYPYYKNSEMIYHKVDFYFDKKPKDFFKWLEKNESNILEKLSI